MPTPSEFDDLISQVTGGGDFGDETLSLFGVRGTVAELIETMLILVDDEESLPADAEIRPGGLFINAFDVAEYLERGGLLIRLVDEDGKTTGFQPVGFVYAVMRQAADQETIEYQIYIRPTSE